MAGGEGLHLGHRGGGGADDAKEPREQWPESPIAMRGVHTVLPEDSLSRASSSAGVLDHQAGTPHKQPRSDEHIASFPYLLFVKLYFNRVGGTRASGS
jgi:hypothetical protein